jgi:hypothetical protein
MPGIRAIAGSPRRSIGNADIVRAGRMTMGERTGRDIARR